MRISDWSAGWCSADLAAIGEQAMNRPALRFDVHREIAKPLGEFVGDFQLLGREHDLQSAIGNDLVGDVHAIDAAGLGTALDDWQQAKPVSCDVGKGRDRKSVV